MSTETRAVATSLFVGEGAAARLLAGRRKTDGRLVFPLPVGGRADQFDVVELGRDGVLWSWTVQRFAPKEPYDGPVGGHFRPYGVGYIELPGELIVESRLVDVDLTQLRIGMPMSLTTELYRTDPNGGHVMTYAFRPRTLP
jgi:uncharacterized OB-fold protein